jgi:serine/threonine protein kinase
MIGQTISHYKILEKLGEGGMGVVYKAEDTKLDRLVALKFLPAHLAASEQDKARFIQEAKAASAINHPNICTIFSIDEHDGKMFIVMEFVDGQTLREKKNSINFKQAIDIGIQIADGLAAAHEKGIVHRDIKPENIMIRKDGIAQIMDFGLAKLRSSGSKITRLTKEGSTVGTAGYMSPEQVQGQDTDHRSDIFSYGVLLYELLTGQLPFKGVHETALAYEIVNVDPAPMSSVKPEIDPSLDAIVLECLEKDPRERNQSIAQISLDLKRHRRESSRQKMSRITATRPAIYPSSIQPGERLQQDQSEHSHHTQSTNKLIWIVTGVSFIGMVAFALLYFKQSPPDVQSVWSYLLPPEKFSFATQSGGAGEGLMELSPNGKMMVFVASDSVGKTRLMVRAFNGLSTRDLPATEGASYPFWSPDNRNIGFFQAGKLKKIEASGGPPITICDAADARGGTWNQDGVIIFAPTAIDPLYQVSAAGGTPSPITKLDSTRHERTHRWPYFLPDGKHFLYFSRSSFGGVEREEDALMVTDLDGKLSKRLMSAKGNVSFASGSLIYLREKTLMAQPFDVKSLELSGEGTPIAEPVEYDLGYNRAVFSVSQNGILVYQSSGTQAGYQLQWFDRSGKMVGSIAEPGDYGYVSLSPDGRTIAFDMYDGQSRNRDIWLYDLTRKLKTRFTFDPSVDEAPVWSPDGSRLVFHSDRKGHYDLYQKTTSGAGVEEVLFESSHPKTPSSWSSDGKYILFVEFGEKTKSDLWILPLEGDKKPFIFLQTDFDEYTGVFSPDTRWIAYLSNESGSFELYIRPFMGMDGKIVANQTRKWQVSSNGISNASWIQWSKDGKQLYYVSSDNKMMVVDVKANGDALEIGTLTPLFEMPSQGLSAFNDISTDGTQFLLASAVGGHSSPPLTLVTHWTEELKKK